MVIIACLNIGIGGGDAIDEEGESVDGFDRRFFVDGPNLANRVYIELVGSICGCLIGQSIVDVLFGGLVIMVEVIGVLPFGNGDEIALLEFDLGTKEILLVGFDVDVSDGFAIDEDLKGIGSGGDFAGVFAAVKDGKGRKDVSVTVEEGLVIDGVTAIPLSGIVRIVFAGIAASPTRAIFLPEFLVLGFRFLVDADPSAFSIAYPDAAGGLPNGIDHIIDLVVLALDGVGVGLRVAGLG